MKRIGRPRGLITWDTLSRQKAKEEGRREPIKLLRARTLIYVGVLTLAAAVLMISLSNRATVILSVQRDRAPIFVKLADGSLRNGYTLKIANKLPVNRSFDLSIEGLPGAKLAVSEGSSKPDTTLRLLSSSDQVETLRLLVSARPDKITDGSLPVDFVLRDTMSGAQTVYHSTFMGPAGYSGGTP